jgi:hypothetical protein
MSEPTPAQRANFRRNALTMQETEVRRIAQVLARTRNESTIARYKILLQEAKRHVQEAREALTDAEAALSASESGEIQ